MILNEIITKNYTQTQKTISMGKANLYSIIVMGPSAVIAYLIYSYVWRGTYLHENPIKLYPLYFLIAYIVLIIFHELVHGFVFHFFCENKWKSIKFGIIKKYLMPYCHCEEALQLMHYRLGTIAPLIVTGILPYVIALISDNFILMLISLPMIVGAGGDITILLLLRNEKNNVLVLDHETLCGCTVYCPIDNKLNIDIK